ncbi:MAG: hypothetical protein ABSE92_16565, partial [Terriglobales bacterium]
MANALLDEPAPKQRPEAVTAIAWLFGLSGIYLGAVGLVMLIAPLFSIRKLFSVETAVRLGR